jgi:hypothetical protein
MSTFPVKKSDLEIKIRSYNTEEGVLEIFVPYPENYPLTEFKKHNTINIIAYLAINFKYVKTDNYIDLEMFFVYSSKSHRRSKYATKEEIELTKGLGKKMLCYAINLLIKDKIIDKMSTMIKLAASGGYCQSKEDTDKILSQYTIEDMNIWIFKNIKTPIISDMLLYSKEDKARIICEVFDNMKLVKYYEEYGLIRDEVPLEKLDLRWIPMTGYVYNVLRKCDDVYTAAKILYGLKSEKVNDYGKCAKKRK